MPGGFLVRIDHGVIPPPGGPVKTRLAVRAVIERVGLLLMVHSSVNGDWKFPGGGVEPRETPEEALAREILEETGYETQRVLHLAGRAVERAEGRDVPGSLFEMESRYYVVLVEDNPGDLALDEYERDLGFTPRWIGVAEALAANRALQQSGRAHLPPWLDRETRVLKHLFANSSHRS